MSSIISYKTDFGTQYGLANIGDMSLPRYIAFVRSIPMLSEEDECDLVKRFIDNKDQKAAHAIILAHLRLVVKIAFDFKNNITSLKDLISEGNLGLIKALNSFIPQKGIRFGSYAILWVKSSIQRFIVHSKSIIQVGTTNMQRKIIFHLNKVKRALGITSMSEVVARADEVANAIGVETQELLDYLRAISQTSLITMTTDDDSTTQKKAIVELLTEESLERDFAHNLDMSKIYQAVCYLNEKEQEVIALRFLCNEQKTLAEIAEIMRLTTERVRQIESNAIAKLRKYFANS